MRKMRMMFCFYDQRRKKIFLTGLILCGLMAQCLAGCGVSKDSKKSSPESSLSGTGEETGETGDPYGAAMESGEESGADGYAAPKDSIVEDSAMTEEIAAEEPVLLYNAEGGDTEEYHASEEHGFFRTKQTPLSTFSADVDTASYSNVRRMLMEGRRADEIPKGAVRLEEMLNYFHYEYEAPKEGEVFGVTIDGTACPWEPSHGLVRIGVRTQEIDFSDSPKSNLVFLLDVSGSMDDPGKLPLLKQAFGMLVENLGEKDRVSIVTYAGTDEIVLDGARGNEKGKILDALYALAAEGSTNGGAGISTAYALAEEHLIQGGNNRVILATDGDLNVGQTSESQLQSLIEEKRKSGVYLSVLGFGDGNLKDNKLETLADQGNGHYAYIDSLMEARRVLVDEMGSTLLTVAQDVKFQVEFNPAQIAGYRLLGYENRLMDAQDFTDDTKDAGELGAGHTVTVLYEVEWAGQENSETEDLKYQKREPSGGEAMKEWATLKIRYKEPGAKKSQELAYSFGQEIYHQDLSEANMRLEASVAEFGMLLKDSDYKGNSSYEQILDLWKEAAYGGNEEIAEFLMLVEKAGELKEEPVAVREPQGPPEVELMITDREGEITQCIYATRGSYEWTIPGEGETAESMIACSSAPTEWKEIATLQMAETDGKVTLGLARNRKEYSVCYWQEGATCGVADPVEMDGDAILLGEYSKGVYEIHVTYLEGEAYYGFKVE